MKLLCFNYFFNLFCLVAHLLFMCVQEVIGKSVKQAVFLPLYSVPERYDVMSLFTICITWNITKLMWLKLQLFVHVLCLSSSEKTLRLFELPSLYVKHKYDNGLHSKMGLYSEYFYVVLQVEWQKSQNAPCFVLHARDFTLQALPITQRNRPKQVCVTVGVCVSFVFCFVCLMYL